MTRRKRTILALSVLVAMNLIVACRGGDDVQEPTASAQLVGTQWKLTSLHGRRLIEDTEITLTFEEAYLGGSMTCNLYGGGPDSGKYTGTDDGALKIRKIAVTVQLCPEPEGIMEQEETYIDALRDAAAYRIVDGHLEIMDADAKTTLVYQPKE